MSLGLQKVIAEPPEQARRWEYSRFAFALAGVSWSILASHSFASRMTLSLSSRSSPESLSSGPIDISDFQDMNLLELRAALVA